MVDISAKARGRYSGNKADEVSLHARQAFTMIYIIKKRLRPFKGRGGFQKTTKTQII